MKKDNKLHINFHNPNSDEETAKFLTKLVASVAVEKYLDNISKNYADSTEHNRLHLLSK